MIGGQPHHPLPVNPLEFEQLPDALRRRLAPRVERLGYLGAFFAYAAHQPDALAGFVDYTESLKGALPIDLSEIVALVVASRLDNAYELVQHQRLARHHGFDDHWIDMVMHRPAALDDARQRATCELVEATLARSGHDARPAFERLVACVGEADAIGVLLLIGRFVAHAHVANTLELTSPIPAGT